MSEPLTDDVLTAVEAHAARYHDGQHVQNDIHALIAEVRRLRAENADLYAAACTCERQVSALLDGHAAGCPAVERVKMRAERDGYRDAYHAALARAGRLADALAHIEARGHHAAACIVHSGIPASEWRCDPACPTATAKRAREETK